MNSDRITQIGVFAAIAHELDLMRNKGLFRISFINESADDGSGLPGDTQLLVFRMFQEIFNNIIKHAAAKFVMVTVTRVPDGRFSLCIADNGKGFDLPSTEKNGKVYNGVGLRSLASRAGLFGGNIEIKSVLQEGTTITIFIPEVNDPIPKK
jgi:signal transduction histidine kinase